MYVSVWILKRYILNVSVVREHQTITTLMSNDVPRIPAGLKRGDVVMVRGDCGMMGNNAVAVVESINHITGKVHLFYSGHGVAAAEWDPTDEISFSARGDRLVKQPQLPNTRVHRRSERNVMMYPPHYWRNLANGTLPSQ